MLKSVHSKRQRLLCESLEKARREAGLTQAEVARRLGKAQSFVSRYETGERRLDVLEFLSVAQALQMKAPEFLRRFERRLQREALQ